MALFEFASATAGAQLVSADFGLIAMNRLGGLFVVFVGVKLLHAAPGPGHWSEHLLDLLRRKCVTGGHGLRNHLTRRNRLELRRSRTTGSVG